MIGNFKEDFIYEIGCELASGWGGECIEVKYDESTKEYIFDCIENGERFYSTLTEEEIKEFYPYMFKEEDK